MPFPASLPKTPRKTSPERDPRLNRRFPSLPVRPAISRPGRRRPSTNKSRIGNTAPRMPSGPSEPEPEGPVRQRPPKSYGHEPILLRSPPGTLRGTCPGFVPPSGPAPRPGSRSDSAGSVLGRTTCGGLYPNRARFSASLPRNRSIGRYGLRRPPLYRFRAPRRTPVTARVAPDGGLSAAFAPS